MNKSEVLTTSRAEMSRRNKAHVDTAWFPDETSDDLSETITVLRQLEREGKIRVTDRASNNIISCFVLA
ncbi:TPA: hypothetical protein I8509_001417 [Citrobacter freundii]|uniref:hypothetical protein n=1 Tax=Citrobacter freundii TaxID=546 RepID=UPI001A2E9FEA|nr:hypothetical protein [Citrobacter freundii]HAT3426346.1 hypothetical protein [Citrobacter freundii]